MSAKSETRMPKSEIELRYFVGLCASIHNSTVHAS